MKGFFVSTTTSFSLVDFELKIIEGSSMFVWLDERSKDEVGREQGESPAGLQMHNAASPFSPKIKLPGRVGVRAICLSGLVTSSYFFLRAIRPDTSEPRPSNPSRGSGEPVCGRLAALLAFWSEVLAAF